MTYPPHPPPAPPDPNRGLRAAATTAVWVWLLIGLGALLLVGLCVASCIGGWVVFNL